MENGETKQMAREWFLEAWNDFIAEPVYELSVLKYHYRRCSKAFDLDPSLVSSLPVASKLMGLLNFGLGVCAAEEGLMEETKVYYEEAIKSLEKCDGLDWMSFWVLGKALREVGEIEKSVPAFQQAVELAVPGNACGPEPTNELLARLWDEFAGVYSRLEKPNDAADCYEWATLYSPDSRFLQSALAVASWFAGRYERVIAVSRWALCSDGGVVVPPLLLELRAAAAIRTRRLEVAVEAYEKLLAECKNPEARGWYSRMLGYVEGHRDSCKGALLWDVEGFEWTSWHDRYNRFDSEGKPMTLDRLADDVLRRDEFREDMDRIGLWMLGVKEGLERIHSPKEERVEVCERLRSDIFGDQLWGTLKKATQDDLVQGEMVATLNRRSGGNDYSDSVIRYAKAFNFELGTRILAPFKSFVKGRGLSTLTIAGREWDCYRVKGLPWQDIGELLREWCLILAPPKNISQNDLRLLPGSLNKEFLDKYSGEQKDLISELADILVWMPDVVRRAEHKEECVTSDELLKLRSGLIGSQAQLGLFVRLVRLFPTAR